MPDESDKATLDNNVARGDSVFLPTTDNHAGGLNLDEEVVVMPDPANDGNVNPPAAGAPRMLLHGCVTVHLTERDWANTLRLRRDRHAVGRAQDSVKPGGIGGGGVLIVRRRF